jgi:hypothetical protein
MSCEYNNGNCNSYAKSQVPLPVSNGNLYGILDVCQMCLPAKWSVRFVTLHYASIVMHILVVDFQVILLHIVTNNPYEVEYLQLNPAFPLSPIRATCATHPFLDMVNSSLIFYFQSNLSYTTVDLSTFNNIIYIQWYSLRSFLQSPVTSSDLGLNIFHSTLFSSTLSLYSSCNVGNAIVTPIYNTKHCSPGYFDLWIFR